jgi:hypothetical protein
VALEMIRWLSFTAILLIAFFFRFYRLADHPLGIFFDPAINGLDAVRLMERGGHVIFFPSNGGRESFFIYLLIPYIWLFGTTPFSIRALTSSLSLINVALLIAFLYDISSFSGRLGVFPGLSSRPVSPVDKGVRSTDRLWCYGVWLATLGGLSLAVSYWHITISRLGQRPILVPVLSVPIFWLFLRGWVTGQRRWFILSGLFLGLAGYTYSAARLLPVILLLALLPELWLVVRPGDGPRQSEGGPDPGLKTQLINLAVLGLAALVIYMPMGFYLLTHPGQFTGRALSVMVWNFLDTRAEIMAELGRNLIRTAGFFCCDGSPNPLFGLPHYPGSHVVVLPLLIAGLIGSLRYWRFFFPRLVSIWWIIGLLPTVLAIEAPHPLRMIVAVVPTAILVALGAVYLVQWLSRWRPGLVASRLFPITALIILLPAFGTFTAYFSRWTQLQSTRGAYDYAAVAIRDAILAHTDQATPVYLPLSRVNAPSLLYYLSESYPRQARLSAPVADTAIVISPEENMTDASWVRLQNGQATVLPPLSEAGLRLLHEALTADGTEPIRTADGEIIARLAVLSTDPGRFAQGPEYPLDTSFGPVTLAGAAYPAVVDPQAKIPVTLFWQANQAVADEYEVLVRLVDDNRRAWGNGDARPTDWVYPTSFWQPGLDQIGVRHDIEIVSDAPPPGRYWLAVSVLDPALGRRLTLPGGAGQSPDTVFLGPLKVPLIETSPIDPQAAIDPVTFGDAIQLTGITVDRSEVQPGGTLQLSLSWRALATPALDYTIFVHLLDADGNLVTGHDAQPGNGQYPTTIWAPAEEIVHRQPLPLPDDLPSGQYRLAVGLYFQPTGERLRLQVDDGRTVDQNRLILDSPIQVGDQP